MEVKWPTECCFECKAPFGYLGNPLCSHVCTLNFETLCGSFLHCVSQQSFVQTSWLFGALYKVLMIVFKPMGHLSMVCCNISFVLVCLFLANMWCFCTIMNFNENKTLVISDVWMSCQVWNWTILCFVSLLKTSFREPEIPTHFESQWQTFHSFALPRGGCSVFQNTVLWIFRGIRKHNNFHWKQ